MNIDQILENMTQEEAEQLLATDFGADLEKSASAELAQADLAEALYAYGSFMASVEVDSTEELSKEASAEIDEAATEIATAIEESLAEANILDTEDTATLHTEAQAAAGIIFQGYADQIEKIAAEAQASGEVSKMQKIKNWAKAQGKKVSESKAAKHVMANKGKYGAGLAAGALLGGGAYAYKKKHEKKASEVTASEMSDIIRADQEIDAVISAGISKLASEGAATAAKKSMKEKMEEMGSKIKGAADKVKASKFGQHVAANKGKYKIGAGAAALGGAGLLAHKMMSKKDK